MLSQVPRNSVIVQINHHHIPGRTMIEVYDNAGDVLALDVLREHGEITVDMQVNNGQWIVIREPQLRDMLKALTRAVAAARGS